jgi:hypothetical protein
MTPLIERTSEELVRRNFSPMAIRSYLHAVQVFQQYLGRPRVWLRIRPIWQESARQDRCRITSTRAQAVPIADTRNPKPNIRFDLWKSQLRIFKELKDLAAVRVEERML